MAICIRQLFVFAADLTFASVISCALYVLVCLCVGGLICMVVFLSSFGVMKSMKRNIGQQRSTITTKVSESTLGGMLVRKLDKANFGVWTGCLSPERESAPVLKKGYSSNTTVAQLPVAKEKYQKVTQTRINNQLSLKGMSGVMKKPSVMIREEETELPKEFERKAPLKQKNGFATPAFLIALLWAPMNIMCSCLKKLFTARRKSQD